MRIRPAERADLPSIARVFTQTTRHAFNAFTPGGRTESGLGAEAMVPEGQALIEFAWDLWWGQWFAYVAELRPGEVVGFSCGGAEATETTEHRVQMRGLYVLPEHQGGLVGRFLASAVASRFLELGHRSLMSWVLEQNVAARDFHVGLGGEPRYRVESVGYFVREVPPGPEVHALVGYVWDDASALVIRRRARS
ncbi:MAG: GNAT family N-acetyltransferase [Myxococcaceae bacterium]|nr:GNAT family N-acetyltransferase [Myxococcaceae bacterium]